MDRNNNEGFTLIELLIAMAIAAIVMTGVYLTFQTQQGSYIAQENLSHMQQNMRSAMYFMEKEIRMAGCNPTEKAQAKIEAFGSNTLRFTMDIVDDDEITVSDGDVDDDGELIEYSLNAGNRTITREDVNQGGGAQPIAENIEVLQFYYLDIDGNETASQERIRSVQIAVVARTGQQIRGYRNNETYQVTLPDGTVKTVLGPQNDSFRRKLLTTVIKCRNLGA
jgi:type IV pilus assembly protein PilW